eukprot:TRINITY_DN25759_c0_g1_i1.p1 TRINITY_DN25759_c0_g1~~TRINITY_DN25759_c0_g1_i1.p1  ORF type:complete len:449 (-),score=141.56 TRINITY_DN25759_c0_g1_i1:21-1367(-)
MAFAPTKSSTSTPSEAKRGKDWRLDTRILHDRVDDLERKLESHPVLEEVSRLKQQVALLHCTATIERKEDRESVAERFRCVNDELASIQGRLNEVWARDVGGLDARLEAGLESLREHVEVEAEQRVRIAVEDCLQAASLADIKLELDRLADLEKSLIQICKESQSKAEGTFEATERSLQALQVLHQQLSLEVGKKADGDELERRLQLTQREFRENLDAKPDRGEFDRGLASVRAELQLKAGQAALDETAREASALRERLRTASDEVAQGASAHAGLQERVEALERSAEEQLRLQADVTGVTQRVDALTTGVAEQNCRKADGTRLDRELQELRRELVESLSQKAERVATSDAVLTLQFQHREAQEKAAKATEELRKGMDAARRDLEDRIVLSEISLREAFAEALAREVSNVARHNGGANASLQPYYAQPGEVVQHTPRGASHHRRRRPP